MTPLSPKTRRLVEKLCQPQDAEEVTGLLENECGQNLPFWENSTPESLQRLRFAVLKISQGRLPYLLQAVSLAKTDWRDLLVWAEFANELDAHERWAEPLLEEADPGMKA